jgi:long-chain acyl-CoA synthetase
MDQLRTLESLVDFLPKRGDKTSMLALYKEGAKKWSYSQLGDHALWLAHGLRKIGIRSGEHVGLLAGVRFESVVVSLGVIKTGAVIMPLDVQTSPDMLIRIIKDSGAEYIFTTMDYVDQIRDALAEIKVKIYVIDIESSDEADNVTSWRKLLMDETGESVKIEPDDPAVLFYTSGTTGPPKGVPLTHKNLAFQLNTVIKTQMVTERDRVFLPLPLHHVYPFVIGTLVPLSLGLAIIIPQSLTGPQILRAICEGEVTTVIGVPRLYRALYSGIDARAGSAGKIVGTLFNIDLALCIWLRQKFGLRPGKLFLRSLHNRFGLQLSILACGGAALDTELAWKLEGLGWKVGIGYGLTETSPLLTLNPPGRARLGSVGKVIEGVQVRIDSIGKPGESEDTYGQSTHKNRKYGEILAKGPSVFSGYLNMPEKTREVLTGDGWFRTGDLGYFDEDGYLYVTGRISTMIITESGENIQPDEVEEVYDAHVFIKETGVFQRENKLVAVIVPEMGEIRRHAQGDIEEIIVKAVREQSKKLASYKRISDYAVTQESLARTRIGKIRRHLLPGRYEEAKTGEKIGKVKAGPIPIREMSDRDRALLEDKGARKVWDWLAERYREQRLTPDTDTQLDLEVDSLEWLNITMEIRQHTGIELDEKAIARIETIRDLLSEVAEFSLSGETAHQFPALDRPESVLSNRQKQWLKPLSPGMLVIAHFLFKVNQALVKKFFKLEVKGLENLPEEGQFIFTPNHVSYLDSFVIAAAFSFDRMTRTYWAGWTGAAFANPFNSFVSRLAQTIPIDPEKGVFSSLAFAAAVIKQGKNLVWFPEGTRSPNGKLLPFKPGIGILLERFQVRVVPVFIHGTYEAMPVGRLRIRRAPVKIAFGHPLDTKDLEKEGMGDEAKDRIVAALHNRIIELGADL